MSTSDNNLPKSRAELNKIEKPNKKRNVTIAVLLIVAAILLSIGIFFFVTSESDNNSDNNISNTFYFEDSSDNIDWESLPTTYVTLNDNLLEVTEAGTYVLSGESSAGVIVNSSGSVRLALNNASIVSPNSAAIYVENARHVVIHLADGTNNKVSDTATRANVEIDGVIFSSDDLTLNGEGSLEVIASHADGIVSKDNLKISSGTFNITSADDGIRGKDTVNIAGGQITINAAGDGIKSTNDTDRESGVTLINGGNITITSGDDAIKGENKVVIEAGTINIKSSIEGIEAPIIIINDGDITLYATDDGINASESTLITSGMKIAISGGTINISVGPGDTDGIDSNGDIYINGGTINITAQMSAIDYEGVGELNGGTLIINGTKTTTMPSPMGGGAGNPMQPQQQMR